MSELILLLERLHDLDRERTRILKDRGQAETGRDRQCLLEREKAAALELNRLETALKADQMALNEAELDLRSCEEHLAQSEKRLYGGEVANAKELAQLEQRVSEERRRRSELEDRCLALMERLESDRSHLEEAGRSLHTAREALSEFDRAGEEAAILQRQEDEAYEHARRELLAGLPGAVRDKYLRMQERYPCSALARIHDASCSGCHTSLSQAEIERARREPGQTTCENCGRILSS